MCLYLSCTTTHTQRSVGVAGAAVSALRAAKGIHDQLPRDESLVENGGNKPAAAAAEQQAAIATTAADGAKPPVEQEGQGADGKKPTATTMPTATTTPEEEEKAAAERERRREEEAQKVVVEGLPAFVQLMWRISALDVQVNVCMHAGVVVGTI